MARCPFAVWRPLPENANADKIVPRVVILHTAVANVPSLFGFFAKLSETKESHFYVASNGVIEQYMDTERQADANREANDFAISVENQDNAANPIQPMTPEQLDANIRLFRWCSDVHPTIKRQRCEKWDGSGYGYHTMWGAPSRWTPVAGKTCPAPARIDQFNKIMIPALTSPGRESEKEWPYMDDVAFVRHMIVEYLGRRIKTQAELDAHVFFVAANGRAKFLTNLADSPEAVAYLKAKNKVFGFADRA